MQSLRRFSRRGWFWALVAVFLVALGPLFSSSISNGSAASGPAGGDLTGTYPNPTVATIGGLTPGTIAFSQSAAVTVTGVTVITTLVSSTGALGSLTLPANFFKVTGSILRVHYQGTQNQGGTATADDVYTIALGGTTAATGQADALLASTAGVARCMLDLVLTATAVGASGTLAVNGGMVCDTPGSASANPIWVPFVGTANTFNTTGTLLFNFSVTPGATAHTNVSTNLVLSNL